MANKLTARCGFLRLVLRVTARPIAKAFRHNFVAWFSSVIMVAVLGSAMASGFFFTLHQAVEGGDLARVKQLLAAGAEINATDGAGRTPLHFATGVVYGGVGGHAGHPEIARLLIETGADLSLQNKDGATPLHIGFALYGYQEFTEFIETLSPAIRQQLVSTQGDWAKCPETAEEDNEQAVRPECLSVSTITGHFADPQAKSRLWFVYDYENDRALLKHEAAIPIEFYSESTSAETCRDPVSGLDHLIVVTWLGGKNMPEFNYLYLDSDNHMMRLAYSRMAVHDSEHVDVEYDDPDEDDTERDDATCTWRTQAETEANRAQAFTALGGVDNPSFFDEDSDHIPDSFIFPTRALSGEIVHEQLGILASAPKEERVTFQLAGSELWRVLQLTSPRYDRSVVLVQDRATANWKAIYDFDGGGAAEARMGGVFVEGDKLFAQLCYECYRSTAASGDRIWVSIELKTSRAVVIDSLAIEESVSELSEEELQAECGAVQALFDELNQVHEGPDINISLPECVASLEHFD